MTRQPPLSRRTFLKLTATVAAGAALASCSPKQNPTAPTEAAATAIKPTIPPSSTSGVLPTNTTPAETNPTDTTSNPEPTQATSPAYMAVAHGPDAAAITRAAIEALGGMASFVSSGYDVIIKPNICTDYHPPEYATTTNPTVVGTLVSLCLEAGAKRVRVMDYPFGGTAKSAYAISGIILDRGMMHFNLSQRIADLTSLVRPALTVIDAVRILTNHGPTGGDLADVQQKDTIVASRDIVAADAYATTLFGLTGADIGYIQASADMGLGSMDLNNIDIQEINLG